MKTIGGALARGALAMAGRRSPWGNEGGDGSGSDGSGDEPGPEVEGEGDKPTSDPARGPRNPWLPPSDKGRRSAGIDDIFKPREPRRPTGNGPRPGRFPQFQVPEGRNWLPIVIGAVAVIWLGVTSFHMVGPKDQGTVTTFGRYSRTIGPGVSLTLPWPIQSVEVTDVTSIQRFIIPEGESEKLMLTSDQNLVDISYLVRWNIKNLKDYRFRLSDPDQTVREIAESAMRSAIAEITLDNALSGAGRAEVEMTVRQRMQQIIDYYRVGVVIQGVEIKKADPPTKVVSAFQQVTAAQQDAERDRSNARAWAQQLLARAQGDAAAFDKVYEQYKLAPEVTKRRMYYETMERVLSNNDKVVVESGGVTPYLPLPEVRRKSAPSATATGTAPVAPSTPARGATQ